MRLDELTGQEEPQEPSVKDIRKDDIANAAKKVQSGLSPEEKRKRHEAIAAAARKVQNKS